MKLNKFWFGFLLCLSIIGTIACFDCADAAREYDALGGEVFMIALPFAIVQWRVWTVEQIQKSKKKK